jgi:hypothetical protein
MLSARCVQCDSSSSAVSIIARLRDLSSEYRRAPSIATSTFSALPDRPENLVAFHHVEDIHTRSIFCSISATSCRHSSFYISPFRIFLNIQGEIGDICLDIGFILRNVLL